ncbi:MAG TPA: hypothetical protein VFC19_13040 [Candidatus Limnocylindrales bacterium]|nr:hypothetical protein [Candidatus Limnocylindrales bacterium]
MEDPPTLLAALVGKAEMSHAEIVAGYHACARDHGEDAAITVRTLRRWMAGDVRTNARPAQRRVARLYWGHTMTQLLAAPQAGQLTTERTYEFTERRMAVSVRRAAQFANYAEATNIGPETVEQLRDEVTRLANAYIRDPVADLIGDLIALQDNIFTLLEGKQRPGQSADLYVIAALACGLLAKAGHDLARPHDAMTQARTMFVCAESAGHLPLQAWARGQQSLTAYWIGRHEEAARFAAGAAALLSGNHTGTVAAWLPALEARAHAQLNRPEAARAALRRAALARDSVAADEIDGIGGTLTFPPAMQAYYAAGTHVHLEGGGSDAIAEANASRELFESGGWRNWAAEAGVHGELALAQVHHGDVDGAREAMTGVLALEPNRRIRGLVTTAQRLHTALRDPVFFASPVAKDLRDEIEAYCRIPASTN